MQTQTTWPIAQPATQLLSQTLDSNHIAPAYLFAGSAGVGQVEAIQTWISLPVPLLCCTQPETRYLPPHQRTSAPLRAVGRADLPPPRHFLTASVATDAANQRHATSLIRIEPVRGITEFLSRPPLEALRSVVVIEQAETMNEAAANVLLKTLEDPGQATLNFNSNHHRVLTSYPGIPRRAYPLLSPRPRSDAPSSHRTRLRGTADPTRYLSNGSGMSRQSDRLLAITRVTSPSAAARAIAATPLIPLEALELARLLVKTLEVSTQIWLSEWLQQFER